MGGVDEFITAALICGALLTTLVILNLERKPKMFKKLTGGLKSKTTIAGLGAGFMIAGEALTSLSNGQPVDWAQVAIGIAIAVVGALSKDHKPDAPSGPDYRNLN